LQIANFHKTSINYCRSGTDDEEWSDFTQLLTEVLELREEGAHIKARQKQLALKAKAEAKAVMKLKNKQGVDVRLAAMMRLQGTIYDLLPKTWATLANLQQIKTQFVACDPSRNKYNTIYDLLPKTWENFHIG
jgi:hypothetical protein